jgi:hypothetical protein
MSPHTAGDQAADGPGGLLEMSFVKKGLGDSFEVISGK